MHAGVFYSHLVSRDAQEQAQRQPCLALGSLSSEMWDLALGEMLLAMRPTQAAHTKCSHPYSSHS